MLAADTYDNLIRTSSDDVIDHLNLQKGKNGTSTFLPLNTKLGGLVTFVKKKEIICLTEDQASHSYKKVELEGVINIDKKHRKEKRIN